MSTSRPRSGQPEKIDHGTIHQKPRLLLVDDEPELLALLPTQLGNHFEYTTARTADEGTTVALNDTPDCIVCDVALPGRSGLELVRNLRADQRTASIPIILLSALRTEKDRIRGYEALADLYITKPYNVEELKASILGLIRIRGFVSGKTELMPALRRTPEATSEEETFILRLEEIIYRHLSNPSLTVNGLAEAVFVSKRQLERKMRNLKDMGPAEYLRHMRMEQAWTWLRARRYTSIKDVCHAVGYRNERSFRRAFQAVFGINPSRLLRD